VKEFARPTIRNCEIYDNYGWLGGGVSLHSIPHVNIYNNRIHDNHGYSGGTVYAYFADDLNVSNNLIYNNDSESTSMYGGVLLNRSDNAYIYGNEIFDNTDMQGITINFSHGTVLEQNEFYGNRSAIDQNFGSGGTRVYDNHIYNNTNRGRLQHNTQ
jgi:parallel beta-helix repeat protein